jgi:hypothetical protein
MRSILKAAGAVLVVSCSFFPQEARGRENGGPRDARSEDVASIDAIIATVYEVISGPAGERDWDRFRSLFAPGGRLIPTRANEEGGAEARVGSVEDYIEGSGAYFKENAFYESEIARVTETFGNIAHAFSTYESRRAPGEAPFTRGINSFQLLKDGDRWWVVTIFWDGERRGNPIPAKYLPGEK